MSKKTWWSVCLALILFCTIPTLSQESKSSIIPNAYIVKVAKGADVGNVAKAVGRATGGTVDHLYTRAFKGFSIRVPPGVGVQRILADTHVERVEPDRVVGIPPIIQKGPPPGKKPGGGGQPAQTLPTGVDRIDADLSSTADIDGVDERVGVDVAVIDTGIDLDHPDLNVVFNRDFTGKSKNGDDKNGHGTHVAGTIAALDNGIGVVGVAPGARLYALKVLDNSGSGSLSNIIAALDWLDINAGTIEVANMSLSGIGRSDTFREAIQSCVAKGVVIVVAAGNDARDIYGTDGIFNTGDETIPAAYPEVVTVTALSDSDGIGGGEGPDTSFGYPDDTMALFSNYNRYFGSEVLVSSSGGAIDVAAPGMDILSTWKGGTYNTISGTSMSSPHVAGIVALYIASHGRASNAAGVLTIRQAIINAGDPQSAWGPTDTKDPDGNKEKLAKAAGF